MRPCHTRVAEGEVLRDVARGEIDEGLDDHDVATEEKNLNFRNMVSVEIPQGQ